MLKRMIGGIVRRLQHHQAALLSLGVRAGGVLAGFAVTFIIGRTMGAAATGQFALVSQTAMFLAVVGLVGLDVAVVRHLTKAIANKVPVAIMTLARICLVAIGLMSIIGCILWLGGDWVWQPLFGEVVPTHFLLAMGVLLVARGGTQLFGALLRSQHRFTLGQIVTALAIPMATAFALITGLATTVKEALWAASIGGLIALVVAGFIMLRHVSAGPDALSVPLRTILASALPLWGVVIANNLGDWYGLAVAASMLGAAEAGLYRVAVQIAAVLQIISVALFAVYSAKISTAYHSGDIRQVALLARSAVRLSTATAAPAAVCLLVGSGFILAQIGEEFRAASSVVTILVISQLAIVLTGPSGLVLAMSGHERINLAISICGTLAIFLCVPIAANLGRLEGIAACIGVTILLRNICAYFIVRRKLGIGIWTGTVREVSEN